MMNNIHLQESAKLLTNLPKPSLLLYNRHTTPWWRQILDPGSDIVRKWNYIFLIACISSLFLDPLYLLLPTVSTQNYCLTMNLGMRVVVTFWRSVVDIFSFMHIFMKFRMAYVAPSSRVFGKGELVTHPRKIAFRYLKSEFIFDLAAALPLPQVIN